MKKGIFLAAVLLITPVASFAATYDYVDVNGIVRSTEASSAAGALASASNIAPTSGVALHTGDITTSVSVTGQGSVLGASTGVYHYVDQNGVVQSVYANSAAEAFARAVNIDENSGVIVDQGFLDSGDTVPGV